MNIHCVLPWVQRGRREASGTANSLMHFTLEINWKSCIWSWILSRYSDFLLSFLLFKRLFFEVCLFYYLFVVLRRYFLLLYIMLLGFLGYWYTDNPHLSDFILQACSASDSNPSSCKFQPCFKFRSKYHEDVFGKDVPKYRAAPLLMIDGHWRCLESLICLIDPIKLSEIISQ